MINLITATPSHGVAVILSDSQSALIEAYSGAGVSKASVSALFSNKDWVFDGILMDTMVLMNTCGAGGAYWDNSR
ncbi:hypothetical protein GCM10027217_25140 [Pseudomaricurvus hydrocarbonicus]